ncbi:MAG: hypothetical protein DRP87_04135 [Spirochaetes bacterium]|nr:MAG: hypothetical protein DRP87_04135 [Spirochaetota bacterium]
MDDVIEKIKEFLSDDLLELKEISRRQTYITVSEERHFDFCKYLFEELGGRFATATGMDTGDGFEVLYHFCFDSMNRVITVRVKTKGRDSELNSLAPFLPAAEWIEREVHDLLGINFKGHPGLERLILDDSWPEGEYPLRKEKR